MPRISLLINSLKWKLKKYHGLKNRGLSAKRVTLIDLFFERK